jgi:1,4-alpha-glucan branching enzyme
MWAEVMNVTSGQTYKYFLDGPPSLILMLIAWIFFYTPSDLETLKQAVSVGLNHITTI